MMLEVNRKRPREYSNALAHDHPGVFAGVTNLHADGSDQDSIKRDTNSVSRVDGGQMNTDGERILNHGTGAMDHSYGGYHLINASTHPLDDIIVLDSEEPEIDTNFSFAHMNHSQDALIDDFDNDSDVVIIEERSINNNNSNRDLDNNGFEQDDDDDDDNDDEPSTNDFTHGAYETDLSTQFSSSFFHDSADPNANYYMNGGIGLRPFKKPRTKSLPQLPHSRISYNPPPNLHQLVTTKIGEIKTNFVPFNELNYTFTSPSSQQLQIRRISFSNGSSTKKTNGSLCDDKDGHYIVNSGDSFANGRFRIKKLLGQGTFGKVISAHDTETNEVVAIKIIRAVPKYREASKIELRVLSMIKKHDPNNQNHCIHLRECFDYRSHICIVTDLLKISLFDFLEKNSFKPFPGSHIQAIAKQLIRSVAFLHDLKLIHTDLKPENILLHDDSYIRKPFRAPKGKPSTTRILKDPLIQIIDFGSAIFDDEYHSLVVSTRHYRAPEIVLNIGWSFPCDMWSVGCILVELATGEALFRTHENLEHLAMMEKVTGRAMDSHLVNRCFVKNRMYADTDPANVVNCFDSRNGKLLFPTKASSLKSIQVVESMSSLDQLISSKVGLQINTSLSLRENYLINENNARFSYSGSSSSSTESITDDGNVDEELDRDELKFWYKFIDLVKRCFIYNPADRLKAIEALEHPWFDLGIYDDGTIEK